jgi:alkanesulfonate monooxygenase SsuD/methylene tetrahydromethanopterin reductase-like flavin-dependent oxidoreductase (luciferase family)
MQVQIRSSAQPAACLQCPQCAAWDGFFVWEPVWGIDARIQLAAAAMQTSRIRLGTLISPLSRMRPWDMAGKIAALDNLSGGRVTLAVGLGAIDTGFTQFGEVTDRKARAELLDESLDIITGLWRGQPFAYSGKHHTVQPCDFMPPRMTSSSKASRPVTIAPRRSTSSRPGALLAQRGGSKRTGMRWAIQRRYWRAYGRDRRACNTIRA